MAVMPRIGTEFAGYRIEALLGRGGMSVVYRAENARLGNKVALKLLAEELAHDESFRERFVRESRTAAMLNHPNIVTIYDAGDWEGVLYIAMRWVDGDLKQLLGRDGPLSVAKTLGIVGQVGSALDAAHARGLLHRDVKPANILLDVASEPSGVPHAYLADFGLTKHLESRSGITASGQFVGTIDYMSPEQIEGRDVDARTDIYSLGCVLFECLAGLTPFRRETEVAVLWAHMREEPPPVTDARPELPGALDLVIARAVAKDPANRYSSCRELLDDLKQAAGDVGMTEAARTEVTTKLKPHPPRTRRAAPRRWPAWSAAAALLVGAGIGAAAATLLRPEDTRIISAAGTPQETPYDQILIDLIPKSLQQSCRPTERLTPDFHSSIVCRTGGRDVDRVQYNMAKSGRLRTAHFRERALARQLGLPGERLVRTGSCPANPPAFSEWRQVGEAGHRPARGGEDPHGSVMCYRGDGWAAIEWTNNR
ncbi:MAG: serine/threonine-protein kinase, partial [Gaiellaceae bacterium]